MDLENFLATKNLIFSDRLQEARYDLEVGFKNVWVVTTERVVAMGVSPCLYGFTIDRALHMEITRL